MSLRSTKLTAFPCPSPGTRLVLLRRPDSRDPLPSDFHRHPSMAVPPKGLAEHFVLPARRVLVEAEFEAAVIEERKLYPRAAQVRRCEIEETAAVGEPSAGLVRACDSVSVLSAVGMGHRVCG
jgi:hypothetical protein